MNEEISVTLRNNTNQIQPVTLFTEIFAIPSNITGGQTQIYNWDISSESFAYFTSPQGLSIQIDTVPINNSSPVYSAALSTLDVSGVVSALNTLGFGTFTSFGNIISITSNGTYYYGQLQLSPPFVFQVTSNTPAVGLPPALEVLLNGNSIFVAANGISTSGSSFSGSAGDSVVVNYRAGAGATNWVLLIENYLPTPLPPVNIYNIGGSSAIIGTFSFTYPSQGNVLISLSITP